MKASYVLSPLVLVLLIFVNGLASAETDAKDEPKTLVTLVEINTTNFKINNDEKCKNYKPNYSQYKTIIHLVSNSASDGISDGKKTKVYLANTAGTDPVSGEPRRMTYSIDFGSILFGGAGTSDNPAKMETGVGIPGTRITFDGDESHPFEPVPGLRVWDGAIDIDPECGMIVHAKRAKRSKK